MGFTKVKIFFRVLFFYLILGILAWTFFSLMMHSTLLKVQDIVVTGTNRVGDHLVLEASGVMPGENIFSIRSWEVERRVERIPEVRDARVKKVFPRVLLIEIEERKPFAVLIVGDVVSCLDRDSVEVSCYPGEYESLPRIWMNIFDQATLTDSLEMISIWQREFDSVLAGIRADDRRLYILKLHNGIFIRSEGPRNLQEKASLLKPLLREVQVRDLQVGGFDLRMRRDIVLIRNEGENF